MKYLLKIWIVIVVIAFVGCDDIVDSEKNILITKVEYKDIVDNQEENVIMPLKAGKTWYYSVQNFDADGNETSAYVDSAYVLDEVVVDGEKWFEAYLPFLSKNESVLITNTDLGLWVKCELCDNKSFLLAKYPDSNTDFASGYIDIPGLQEASTTVREYLQSTIIKKSSQTENISIALGNYECIKYTGTYQNDNLNNNFYLVDAYNTQLGMVRAELYDINTNQISSIYELIDTAKTQLNSDCQFTKFISLAGVDFKNSHTESIELTNNEPYNINLESIQIEFESVPGTLKIDSPLTFELPMVLQMNESIIIRAYLNPVPVGRFNGTIKVIANGGCWYEITMNSN